MTTLFSPKSSLAIYGEGDYAFTLEGAEKKLSRAFYNVNLNGRQKNLYFNSSTNLEIELEERKPQITNTWLSIYNKLYNLEIFNLSVDISQLVASNLNLYGAKFETLKKDKTKTTKAMIFAGKSSTSPIAGTKINTDYGSNTSYAVYIFHKENHQLAGVNFSKPIHKFSLLEGEYYLDSKNKWGLLLKNSMNYKNNTLHTTYSRIDKVGAFKLLNLYKTKKLNTEFEYSTTNQTTFCRLKHDYKTKAFMTGGFINSSKIASSSSQQTLSYSGYVGYNWKFLEEIVPSLSYVHSYQNVAALSNKTISDRISLRIGYYDTKFPLSINTNIGAEKTKATRLSSQKKELTFNRGLGLQYNYQGFKPWVNFNFNKTQEADGKSLSQEKSSSLSYGVSKNIARRLTFTYSCYQTGNQSKSSTKKTINEYISLDYRFPKIPLTLNTRFSVLNKNKPTSYISLAYKTRDKKDILTKYQNEEIKYMRERPIKFGTQSINMISLTKEISDQEDLFQLGRVVIRVFKDEDGDSHFTKEKDIPMKEIKIKLGKREISTSEEGKASFIDIPPGTYTFSLDASQIPIGITCKTKVDQILEIKSGEDIYLNFPFAYGGKISGGVFNDKNRNGLWDEKEEGVENILLVADDIPQYTSLTGKYNFKNIVPGIIKIKIDKTSLPENFEMTTKDEIEIKVLPKQQIKNINFGIAEIEPQIEFE